MARGEYWQEIYNPDGSEPSVELDFAKEPQSQGGSNKVIANITKAVGHLEDRIFTDCDFSKKYCDFTFKRCQFLGCRFDHNAEFSSVKFTECTFKQCHLGFVIFSRCVFREPTFDKISISSDHTEFRDTSIGAEKFLNAISTNTSYLPKGKTIDYQQNRLFHTKAKVARTILIATEKEPDQDVYSEAHRENVLRWLKWKIHSRKYQGETALSRQPDHNAPNRRSLWAYCPLTIVGWLDYGITRLSGWLTNWGRSIIRPTGFIVAVTFIFGLIYLLFNYAYLENSGQAQPQTCIAIWEALNRSLDISIVAGYTKYINDGKSPDTVYLSLRVISLMHILLGVYWYGLLFPVIVKRTLR